MSVPHKSSIRVAPWDRVKCWDVQLISVDGCPADDFTYDDVAEVIFLDEQEYTYEYRAGIDPVTIVKLNDGRYVFWEDEDPDVDLCFAFSIKALLSYMTEEARSRIMTSLEQEI